MNDSLDRDCNLKERRSVALSLLATIERLIRFLLGNVRPGILGMILQDRDIEALSMLARYFMLTSRQLRQWCYRSDTTGRVTRRRLTAMRHEGFVRKRNLQVVNPRDGAASPVYHLTRQGLELLAGHFDDESLLRKPVEPSQPQHLQHYIARL